MNAARAPSRAGVAAHPHASHRFTVHWTGFGDAPPLGFSQVLLPALPAAVDKPDAAVPSDISFPPPGHLALRRAFDGRRELQRWWQGVRRGQLRAPRTVTVQLLDAEHNQAVMQWRFRGARPVSLAWSPLDAMIPALLTETLVLSFEQAELG
jgi:T4-like virus tail tube protein gp19